MNVAQQATPADSFVQLLWDKYNTRKEKYPNKFDRRGQYDCANLEKVEVGQTLVRLQSMADSEFDDLYNSERPGAWDGDIPQMGQFYAWFKYTFKDVDGKIEVTNHTLGISDIVPNMTSAKRSIRNGGI
jgi:hypothetical protein